MPVEICLEFGGLCVLAKTERCDVCGRHIGRDRAVFSAHQKPVRRFALSATSDGFFVVSKAFHNFCRYSGFTGVDFSRLENGYFVMKVRRCVELDMAQFAPTQEDWCDQCKTFRRNLRADAPLPISTREKPIGSLEVVETCQRWGVEVGEGTAQTPMLIAGDKVREALEAEAFKGINFRDVS